MNEIFLMNLTVLLGMIGAPQIILIVVIVILLFGAKRIPELMKGFGKGIKEFKDATKDQESGDSEEDKKD